MAADMVIQLLEAVVEMRVIVRRQGAGMNIQTEGAQSAAEPQHLAEKFLRVPVLRFQKMPQAASGSS